MKKTQIAIAAALLLAAPAFAQSKDEISLLREQLKQLQDRISQIEQERNRPQPAPATAAAVTAGDIPGSFKLPGTNTSVSIGGTVKAVAIQSSRSPLAYSSADEALLVPTIPLSNVAETGLRKDHWKAHAKESRLFIRTSTPTRYGPMTTVLEGDFFGPGGSELSTNGHGFRLRHAWGTIGNFGAGQFWSNSANLSAVPETVDFSPQIGIFGALRQTGVRWTSPFAGGFWSVALENPESVIVLNSANTGGNTTPDADKFLDLNGKVHFTLGKGEYEAVAMVRKISTAPGPTQVSKTGYAVQVSGLLPTIGKDRFLFGLNASRDMGRNLGGLIADGVVVGTELRGINTTAGYLSYKHFWTETLRSNIAYSWIKADNPGGLSAGTAAGLNKKFATAHLNLIWSVTPTAEVGAEFLHAKREVESGLSGDLNRFLFMAKYNF